MSGSKYEKVVYVQGKNLQAIATVNAETNELTLKVTFNPQKVAKEFGGMTPKEYFEWLERLGAIKKTWWPLTVFRTWFRPLKPGQKWELRFPHHVGDLS